MSMIGVFGICSKSNYSELADLINNGKSAQTEAMIKEIYNEVENSVAKLEMTSVRERCSSHYSIILKQFVEWMFGAAWKGSEKNGEMQPVILT